MADVSMRQMLEAGVHFGHQTRFWSPKMGPYIFGARNKIHIINLEKSLPLYRDAMNFIGSVASARGKVLFVGTKRQAGKVIREEAKRCNSPYVDHRWLGGMLTNFKTVKNSIARLVELDEMAASDATRGLTKKEALMLERERVKLDRSLSGIREMKGLPDALFVIDVDHEKIAVSEARKLGIPVVGVCDTNSSPDGIDYPIPGNDDAIRAIKLYLSGAADAILEARGASAPVIEGDADDYVEVPAEENVNTPAEPVSDAALEPDSTPASGADATDSKSVAEDATARDA
ncbi:MAG: 30S ribosomal protein S2 [Proteobacteria bacterium]|jgi:small subunit ribosomal protein S2|nr:30S ribosomal protein S2 [Pseudomonadota bacterium]MDB4826673.1 30S ribosomal protein S2 [Gammaproteobacteria bacterium]MBT4357925.1 30S ribosomal protein S2 [Pseudomonadota bacterium]MBT4986861.1 30S ribosomal protein S2 [Pseudomonadota bacterium]MBT5189295.1 30S ribosomal protein S2 [Pseudomonadota bacterium]